MIKYLTLTWPIVGLVVAGIPGLLIGGVLGFGLFKFLKFSERKNAQEVAQNKIDNMTDGLNGFTDKLNHRTATMNAKRKMKKTGNAFEEQYKIELEKLK